MDQLISSLKLGDQRSSAGVRIAQTEGQDQSLIFVRRNRELLILSLNRCYGILLGIMRIFRLARQRVYLKLEIRISVYCNLRDLGYVMF